MSLSKQPATLSSDETNRRIRKDPRKKEEERGLTSHWLVGASVRATRPSGCRGSLATRGSSQHRRPSAPPDPAEDPPTQTWEAERQQGTRVAVAAEAVGALLEGEVARRRPRPPRRAPHRPPPPRVFLQLARLPAKTRVRWNPSWSTQHVPQQGQPRVAQGEDELIGH